MNTLRNTLIQTTTMNVIDIKFLFGETSTCSIITGIFCSFYSIQLSKHGNFSPCLCSRSGTYLLIYCGLYYEFFSKLYSNSYLFKMSVWLLFRNSISLLNSVFICWIVFFQFCFDCLHSCMYSSPILITCPYL